MPWTDLGEFVRHLDNEGEVVRIDEAVEAEFDVGAIWTAVTRSQGPVALHEQGTVAGYPDWRVVTNVFGTFGRIARALEVTEDDLFSHVADHISRPVDPEVGGNAPFEANEYTGEEIDLTEQVPNIVWNQRDGGPFISGGQTVLEDPEYGTNTSWYRVQILGPRRVAIRLAPHHQGGVIAQRAKRRGADELDVAIYVGSEPVSVFASAAGVPISTDEYAVMGGLRGAPLELVECRTVDRRVPAAAELVLEGRVQFDETVEEGPFGEFCGTYSDAYEEHPVEITRVAHRDDPIFLGSGECKPINETHVLQSVFKSVNLKDKLESLVPEISDVFYPPGSGGFFEAIVQLDGDMVRRGIPKNVLYSAVAGDATAKMFVLVDDDIDIRNREEVQWALATRMQPEADIVTVPDGMTTQLDPSADADGVTDKVFIDATKGDDFRGELIRVPEEYQERAERILENARQSG